MKTTSRTPQNGSAKRATKQAASHASKKAAPVPAIPGNRFAGVIKWIDSKVGYGFIEVSPEVAAQLQTGPERTLVFGYHDFPKGRDRDARVGARVTFRPSVNERGLIAVELKALTLATELPSDGWEATTGEFIVSTIELHKTKRGDSLNRDKFGQLFIARTLRNSSGCHLGREFRQVSFAQACDWLVNQEHELTPEFFLAKHGVIEQARLARRSEGLNNLKIDDVVSQSFALLELMELQITQEDDNAMSPTRKAAFSGGVLGLRHHVQAQLLALQSDFRAAIKGDVQ